MDVCRSTELPGAKTRRIADVATLTSLPLAGSRQANPLLLRALLPSVSNELTLPAVPTPPLPEPGEEVVRQN